MPDKKDDQLITLILGTIKMVHEQTLTANKLDPFTYLRLKTLRFIAEKRNSSMRDVAGYFNITPPSATSIISALVKMGYVKRIYDKTDRRIIRLKITENGEKNLLEGFKEIKSRMQKILSKLNEEEKTALTKIMEKLSGNHQKNK